VPLQFAGGTNLSDLTETYDLEALGSAINRASGVLLAVGELYSPHDDSFSGGNAFAAHALTTAHGLLVEASQALSSLYAKILERGEYDAQMAADRAAMAEELAHLHQQAGSGTQTEHPSAKPKGAVAALEDQSHGWRTVEQTGESPSEDAVATSSTNEGFARSYQELLEKVTAVEVFAIDHDMQAAPDLKKKLLPLVEGLREELKKLTRVA
jgi:hypothetical protein